LDAPDETSVWFGLVSEENEEEEKKDVRENEPSQDMVNN